MLTRKAPKLKASEITDKTLVSDHRGRAGGGSSSSSAVLLLRRGRDTVDYVLSIVTEYFLSHLQPRPDENEIFAV
jgi:hypothetical protein